MAEIDFSDLGDDFDPEKIDRGGLPLPGKAHLLVTSAEDKGEYVKVVSEIVAHEDPTQVGKNEYNNLGKTGKGSKRSLIFALATGLITKQDIADAKVAGQVIDINFEDAYSASYLGTLRASEHNGRPKCCVEWDFKHVDDPDAKDYPRNLEYAEALSDGTSETPEAPPEQPAKKPAGGKKPPGTTKVTKPPTQEADIPF